jgi:CheY-like chemotaxis protein
MNLAVNAHDAMPQGGTLTLGAKRVDLDEQFCRRRVSVRPGPYVLLYMRDTGVGMTREVLEHAFEPFFTTKEETKGTGLGLSTVYGIVQQSRGLVELDSEPGEGVEVRMYFPHTEAPPAADETTTSLKALPRGSETVLVVEDEDAVRRLSARILQSLGYRVLEARQGRQGLDIGRLHGQRIDLILTDVVMPNMSGPEMINRLKQEREDFKVLYVSGFTPESLVEKVGLEEDARVIFKPFTAEALAQNVRRALEPD